ncbi:hypothetical protein EVJ58_g10654 [Rhodofomes roseus]|uniref:Reverse transcriptase domain-containing protein n=1 Tax=Rhodofomes roseus TaxID=34475 RepID=A0A4Y9XMG0_9APHY|nr:hypothetical protein EVJ58_g10654 [Rhodofomes roseus]
MEELIPGRAMMLRMRWHADRFLTLLNVYAPNNHTENAQFWKQLSELFQNSNLSKPDMILGDFNIVEEAIDRLPTREDPSVAVNELRAFLEGRRVYDGWRMCEPNKKDYSFPQRGGPSCSRLDRIYANKDIMSRALAWEILTTGVPTDHRLVLASVTAAAAPYIGKGRWALPITLLSDSVFVETAIRIGETKWKKAQNNLDLGRSESANPQILFKEFKDELRSAALSETIAILSADASFDQDNEKQREVGILRDKLHGLERRRHGQVQASTTARYILNAECPSKYWSAVNKDKKPRDLFYALKTPDSSPARYITKSRDMTELARNYHDHLQYADQENRPQDDGRGDAMTTALNVINATLSKDEAAELTCALTEDEILDSIKKAGPGKAAGLDGLPYELWLTLHERWTWCTSKTKHKFNCLNFMSMLYNDIDRHGISKNTNFAEGWMCPIYKKNDKRDIANYRPITLLNSDYKVYTRAMANRLGRLASSIIHPDQAGFIPGRRITDQTQMCRVMVDYAEATEENGAIIALDQEKAYDKIQHDYLWRVLEKFGLPTAFIRRIRSLYESAATVVILNGEPSYVNMIAGMICGVS